MNRDDMLDRLHEHSHPWDIAVIGGGATGVGVAVDAASRGFDVVLFEQADFGSGTSSRSTNLIHGGVRYLKQGDIPLVMESLRERSILQRNAPHLVRDLSLIVPAYRWWERTYYSIGLRFYDLLAGRCEFGRSRRLSRQESLAQVPMLRSEGLRGGVLYHDGQFDDARLLIQLARTAADHGAVVVNYAPVVRLLRDGAGIVNGLMARDAETGEELTVPAKVVINATGPFCDQVRVLSDPNASPIIAPSQGIHIVLPLRFLGGDVAIIIPRTKDGRVLFAIPWHGHALVGTTDTPLEHAMLNPKPTDEEIDFVLETAGAYMQQSPSRSDVLSTFAGIRPLVSLAQSSRRTARISRRHYIEIDRNRVVSVAGGKWTTYRKMAEDAVNRAVAAAQLTPNPCITKQLHIHGYRDSVDLGVLSFYGSDATDIKALISANRDLGQRLHPELPYLAAEIVWAARFEMARTLGDVLARRTRALHLNARAAIDIAPSVAKVLANELRRDAAWTVEQVRRFTELGGLPNPKAAQVK